MKPGDFEIGSGQSRAAARHVLQKRIESLSRREVIIGIAADQKPNADDYCEDDSGSGEFARLIGIPYGMTIADGLKAVGGFTDEELTDPKMQTVVHCAEIWTLVH
jgi:hypothetical protein